MLQSLARVVASLGIAVSVAVFAALGCASSSLGEEPKLIFECDAGDFEGPRDVYPPYDYLAISDDGTTLAGASMRGGLAIWDLPQAKPARVLEPLKSFFVANTLQWDLAFFPNEKKLAVARLHVPEITRRGLPPQGTLKVQVFDAAAGKKLNEWPAPRLQAGSMLTMARRPEVVVSEDGAVVAASCSTASMLYDVLKSKIPAGVGFPQLPMPAISVPVSIAAWDVVKNQVRETVEMPWGYVPIALTRSGNQLAVWDGSRRMVAVRDGAITENPVDGREREWIGNIFRMAYSLDGRRLFLLCSVGKLDTATGSYQTDENDRLQLTEWNTADGELIAQSELLPMFKLVAAMNVDAGRFAAAVDRTTIRVCETATKKESSVLKMEGLAEEDQGLVRIAFDRRGRYLAASSELGAIRVWDLGKVYPAAPTK
jgi:WD40 repeat protein